MKKILIILVLAVCLFADANKDTLDVKLTGSSLTATKSFLLANCKDKWIHIKTDDTTQTGFANDSVAFMLYYQIGFKTINKNNRPDTAWFPHLIQLDTVGKPVYTGLTSSLLVQNRYPTVSTTTAPNWGRTDTTSVSGFMSHSSHIIPVVNSQYIRFLIKRLDGNKLGTNLKYYFEYHCY